MPINITFRSTSLHFNENIEQNKCSALGKTCVSQQMVKISYVHKSNGNFHTHRQLKLVKPFVKYFRVSYLW